MNALHDSHTLSGFYHGFGYRNPVSNAVMDLVVDLVVNLVMHLMDLVVVVVDKSSPDE